MIFPNSRYRMARLLVLTLVGGWLALPFLAQAQDLETPVASPMQLTDGQVNFIKNLMGERAKCFSGYHFNSVKFSFAADNKKTFAAGESVVINGTYENNNDYPLTGGVVLARLLRSDETVSNKNGEPVVLEKRIQENIELAAHAKNNFSFTWAVPGQAPAGAYQLELFFLTGAGRYPISGNPYIANSPAMASLFSITTDGNKAGKYVNFDRSKVSLASQSLALREVPPTLPAKEPVLVTVPLEAHSASPIKVTLKSDIYSWSDLDAAPPVQERVSHLDILPGQPLLAQIQLQNAVPGAYEVVMTATPDDASILPTTIKVRFPVQGHAPHVLYAGVGGYENGQAIITTCVVNGTYGAEAGEPAGSLDVSVSADGQVKASDSIKTISDRLVAAAVKVPLSKVGQTLGVSVVAKDAAGKITDQHTVNFAKQLLVSAAASPVPNGLGSKLNITWPWLLLGIIIVLLIVAGLIIWLIIKNKKKPDGTL